MCIEIKKANSWCMAQSGATMPDAVRADIYGNHEVSGDFAMLHTDLTPIEPTLFKVYRDGDDIVVVIAPGDKVDKFNEGDDLEIFFDPYHDHIGYFQFVFFAQGGVVEENHLPYPEAQSSAFPRVRLKEYHWETENWMNVVGRGESTRWLFARFAVDDVFRSGNCCGFNIARISDTMNEADSWNHFTSAGLQDPSGFGHLYLAAPAQITVADAVVNEQCLQLSGSACGDVSAFTLELHNPYGNATGLTVAVNDGAWHAAMPFATPIHGRYRLYPRTQDGITVEPEFFYFDYISLAEPQRFDLCITYDIPDNLRNNVYTPQRLEAQIAQMADCGLSKLYWIDYPTYDEFTALWMWASDRDYANESYAYGDLLNRAAEISKRRGIEFWGIFKPFDLGFTALYPLEALDSSYAVRMGIVEDFDHHYLPAFPGIAGNQQWTMQANSAWTRDTAYPVTQIRLYSDAPIATVSASDLVLWVSDDNKTFTRYTGPCVLRQGTIERPHYRWTPAEKVREQGARQCWYLEMSELQLSSPFLTFATTSDASFSNQTFMLAEVTDSTGHETPITIGRGDHENGISFIARWSWMNYTEEIVDRFTWKLSALGLAFSERRNLVTLLEPSYPEVRQLWLKQVERTLQSEADGIDIRTLCHHNTTHSWQQFAFAEPVRAAFRARFGRDIEPTTEDYTQVRIIRGEHYTEFMRDVRRLADQYGKKVGIHLEPGIEIPVDMNIRMQMHIDWKCWLEEGLIDEITLKYWSPQSKFIQEEVLPRARRANVAVYQGERNFALNTPRAFELAEWVSTNAYRSGLAGFNFYEVHSYFYLNPEGESWPIGNASAAIRHAREAVQQLRGGYPVVPGS